ncbi:MAG: XRE family transcriptional regulator [Paludibacteraceae bacterium]|nr:XRE family transcriptional regulator [Paludibacteraceae bacterium]
MSTEPHIGHVIQSTLKSQGRSIVWFARQMSCDRTNIYKIFSKESIDTKMLFKISQILGVDFFAYLSECLKN